jgi:hypothetical protein
MFAFEVTSDDVRAVVGCDDETAEELFRVLGRYYDMEKDVEIHVVDGPIVMEKTKNISWPIVLEALLGGL